LLLSVSIAIHNAFQAITTIVKLSKKPFVAIVLAIPVSQ
jgi:hypothetical protein